MPSRRRTNAQRGFITFPVDSAEFVSSREGGMFVRLVVEYPEGAIPGSPSIRVALDETYQGEDGKPPIAGLDAAAWAALEGQKLLDALNRDSQTYADAVTRHFPYQNERHQKGWSGSPSLVDDDDYLGSYLAAVSLPAGIDASALDPIMDKLGILYHGFEHGRLGVVSDQQVLVVEHAEKYEYDWPLCVGGSCLVIRPAANPNSSPHLSVPYAAVILLGTTGWSGYSNDQGYWIAGRDDLTTEGRELVAGLEALYPGHAVRLTTWLDT
jgi:hypothetical protein